MAFHAYYGILSIILVLISVIMFIYKHQNQRTVIPSNWPILGMIPAILVNAHRLHDYASEVIIQSGGTFMFKGPWLTNNIDMLFTSNPLDIHHILSKNFNNYPKGDKFHKIFDILGDGILSSDGRLWEINRKVTMSVLKHARFQSMLEAITWNKLENGLLPMLETICGRCIEIDLQDVFQRFTFDTTYMLLLDDDPESLSLDFPHIPCHEAMTDAEQALLIRHITPPCLWKLQQFLRVGTEKKLSDAWKTLDHFLYKNVAQKQNEYDNMINPTHQEGNFNFNFFKALMKEFNNQSDDDSWDPTKFLRDALLNLLAAGKDTTSSALSWFFYILARNPTVEDKIVEEIHTHIDNVKLGAGGWKARELDEMVYLHGALYEALRLFPPVPFNHKCPLKPDILPSGHKVDQNSKIILSFYSMGRMKSIWGEDCLEFKPERWVSKNGEIIHEPSYKFAIFNAGPRTCLGKNMSLYQLKMVSVMIISSYHIQLVEGHPVVPTDSMVLQMKHGLKVKLTKRSEII